MKKLKFSLLRIFAYTKSLGRVLRVVFLRAKGVVVPFNANVSWFAEISPMGGIVELGEYTFIDKGAILRAYGGSIRVGSHCSVNPYCVLYGHGGLQIGDYVRIATQSVFIPSNHVFSNVDVNICEQGETMQGIFVERDVWIGSGVRVLDGVRIGEGSVVAAGSVVSKNVDKYCVYAGVPAKKIKERGI